MPELAARAIATAVERWFAANARPLPWRTTPRDPWRSFVSEAMLQQTQVARVLEKFEPFMRAFPTPRALAAAPEDAVLAAWQGLGYYRRARNLQAAARAIVNDHAGEVPSDPDALRALKGVARYTAGAIASIVFGAREPIVDGNVARVLVRLRGKQLRAGARETETWAWRHAEELVGACADPALLNEGLMELGATVCTPRAPRCDACPLRGSCSAAAAGTPEAYPLPKAQAKKTEVHHAVVVVRDAAGRVLLEKRPSRGLWADMWQPIGVECAARAPAAEDLARTLATEVARRLGGFTHQTSHRTVRMSVWWAATAEARASARWVKPADLSAYALPNPHRRVLALALRESSR